MQNCNVCQSETSSFFYLIYVNCRWQQVVAQLRAQMPHHSPPHFRVTSKSYRGSSETAFISFLATSLLNVTRAIWGHKWRLLLRSVLSCLADFFFFNGLVDMVCGSLRDLLNQMANMVQFEWRRSGLRSWRILQPPFTNSCSESDVSEKKKLHSTVLTNKYFLTANYKYRRKCRDRTS